MDIRLVVFDLDGTLIGAEQTFIELKERLKSEFLSLGIPERILGNLTPMYESIRRIATETGRDFEELYEVMVELETKRVEGSFLFRGAKEVLDLIRDRGVALALMTRSSRRATVRALELHGLESYFSVLSTRDDVPPEDLKPNPGQLKRILDHFGIEPTKTLVIGDHGYDILPASQLGALSILVTSHTSGRMSFNVNVEPNFEVPTLVELKALLEKLLSTFVVVPAYNEERTIGEVLNGLLKYFKTFEIVVVNDGSRDRTLEIARSKGVQVLTHLVNRGLGGALGTGLAYAVRKGGKLILTFDADGQHLIGDALKVMKPVAEGRADFAIGSRLKGDVSEMPAIKRIGNAVLDAITAVFAGKYVSDSQSGLRCFNGECASKIRITCDRYAVSSEIIIEASKHGCRIIEVPIKAVYTDYSVRKGTNVIEGFKIALNLLFDKLR
ncbi:glycosyltransferase [Thermococcus sp.]|uniref:glycosyltransferase n=1 Tax=Thermococcus sp. TaxID=35749 RepID=UPI0025F2AFAB|nr:glycosyltransferase [Thermococcus sp.]